jgi:hypothetical protein
MIDEISGANLDCRNFLSIPAKLLSLFTSNFGHMKNLIRIGRWDEEIERVNKLLQIEKEVVSLSTVYRHPYEISKLTAVINQASQT